MGDEVAKEVLYNHESCEGGELGGYVEWSG